MFTSLSTLVFADKRKMSLPWKNDEQLLRCFCALMFVQMWKSLDKSFITIPFTQKLRLHPSLYSGVTPNIVAQSAEKYFKQQRGFHMEPGDPTCSSWSILEWSMSERFLYIPLLLGFLKRAASMSAWNWSQALVTEFLCEGDFFPEVLSPAILESEVVLTRWLWLPGPRHHQHICGNNELEIWNRPGLHRVYDRFITCQNVHLRSILCQFYRNRKMLSPIWRCQAECQHRQKSVNCG